MTLSNGFCYLAGADIKEMKDNTFPKNFMTDFLLHWDQVARSKKPIIAAVNGYAVSAVFRVHCIDSLFVAWWWLRVGDDV